MTIFLLFGALFIGFLVLFLPAFRELRKKDVCVVIPVLEEIEEKEGVYTSLTEVILPSKTSFKKIHAPKIVIEGLDQETSSPIFTETKGAISEKALIIHPNLVTFPPYTQFQEPTIARTSVHIGSHSYFKNTIKGKSITLSHDVTVEGDLFSDGDIFLGNNTRVLGSVFAQGKVIVGSNCTFGSPEKIKSLIGIRGIHFQGQALIHGYVMTYGKGEIA